jgi:hypothetical protein
MRRLLQIPWAAAHGYARAPLTRFSEKNLKTFFLCEKIFVRLWRK